MRFPNVLRLFDRRRSLVYVQQTTNSDCGAASLAMVLRYHGSPVPLEELQRHLELNRDGANAKGLIETAGIYSLDGTGVSLGVADLDALPSASILHWDFEHFVVFERFDGRSVRIVDPARGRQQITLEEFGARFTGVALVFEPGEDSRRAASASTRPGATSGACSPTRMY